MVAPGLYRLRLKPDAPAIAYSETVLKQFNIYRPNPVAQETTEQEELRMGAAGAINPKFTRAGIRGRKR